MVKRGRLMRWLCRRSVFLFCRTAKTTQATSTRRQRWARHTTHHDCPTQSFKFLGTISYAMPQYSYPPPPLGSDSIRLLRLMPNKDETAPIQCRLCDYPLQKSDKGTHLYEALSYVWGGSDKHQSVFIDGCDLPVTVNLHNALSRLRDRSFERIIWVDSICINQADEQEKGRQIQSMAKIYGQANRGHTIAIKRSKIYVLLPKMSLRIHRSAKRARKQFSNCLNDRGFSASG
jgi:Heterokaryon incompatibility protein (HET)